MKYKMKIYKNVLLLTFLSVVLCILSYGGVHADIPCLICYVLLMVHIVIKRPVFLIKYLYFIIISSWSIVAVYICENFKDIYIGNDISKYYGSFAPYVFAWFVFYLALLSADQDFEKILLKESIKNSSIDRNSGKIPDWMIIGLVILSVINFLLVIRHPAFLVGVNRFYIRDNLQSKLSRTLYKYTVPFLPILVFDRKKHKYAWILFTMFLCLYNFWIGEKFGGFFAIINFVVLGFLSDGFNGISNAIKKKFKAIAIIAIAAVICLIGMVRIQRYFYNPNEDFGKYLSQRIASEGWIWWNTYGGDSGNGFHMDEIDDELQVFFDEPEGSWNDHNFGIYKLMKKFCNPQKVYYMLNARVRGAESGRADFYYYLKIPGLILGQLIFAILFCKNINSMLVAMNKKNVILSYLYALLYRYLKNAFIQSDFYLLTSLTAVVCYIGIIILERKDKNIFWNKKKLALDK